MQVKLYDSGGNYLGWTTLEASMMPTFLIVDDSRTRDIDQSHGPIEDMRYFRFRDNDCYIEMVPAMVCLAKGGINTVKLPHG